MAAYRTRSNTQKLQRLIEFLKERDCDSAANLEASAEVFLNDVKPKAHIDGIPHYDGTESDDGSSYVEEADEKSDKGHDYTRDEKGMTPASLAAIHFPTTYDKTFCHYPTDHISGWLDYCCEHQDTVAGQLKYCPSSTFSQALPH